MIRPPPGSTRTYTLVPYTPPFRSAQRIAHIIRRRRQVMRQRAQPAQRVIAIGRRNTARQRRREAAVIVAEPRQHRRSLGNRRRARRPVIRSEEHTSELQSLMRISYAVFCWKKKTIQPSILQK